MNAIQDRWTLTIRTTDGRSMVGQYHYIEEALMRIVEAQKHPLYKSHQLKQGGYNTK